MNTAVTLACMLMAGGLVTYDAQAGSNDKEPEKTAPAARPGDETVDAVIADVDRECRRRTVYMIGPEKARRLAELVRQKRPKRVVECGTAIGYSGLWIARELKAIGAGRLITIEIDPNRVHEAEENFRRAGLAEFVEVRLGDATELVKTIEGPVDFLFLDCNFANYEPSFVAIEDKLADGARLVADNVGVGAHGTADYVARVRSRFNSCIEWFDTDLPWHKRDAMEISTFRTLPKPAVR
jgi:predicted O-methyltransferase YrrM